MSKSKPLASVGTHNLKVIAAKNLTLLIQVESPIAVQNIPLTVKPSTRKQFNDLFRLSGSKDQNLNTLIGFNFLGEISEANNPKFRNLTKVIGPFKKAA